MNIENSQFHTLVCCGVVLLGSSQLRLGPAVQMHGRADI